METLEAVHVSAIRDVQLEYRESVSIARGVVIGIGVSLLLWGMIAGAIFLVAHLLR
jgi:hypothetical protein